MATRPGGDDLNVAAVMVVFAAAAQVHPAGGAGCGDPVGVDQCAVGDHMGVAGGRPRGRVRWVVYEITVLECVHDHDGVAVVV